MAEQSGRGAISRRSLIAAAGVAASAVGAAAASAQAPPAASPPAGLGTGSSGQVFWVAETSAGKVRGIDNAGIREFKGIPYGAPTGGANRFMAPKPAPAWSGVRDAIGYGQISPQTPADIRS